MSTQKCLMIVVFSYYSILNGYIFFLRACVLSKIHNP